ncbi:MAG: sugar ABC transporter ATP-binding protein [Spirochaetia bacterium]|nr:sugar ABC transporter ATP-binding protein [Spirochaetia bacterium]
MSTMGTAVTGSLLKFKDITKTFPGVKALDSVDMDFSYGEVHALVGENGAGKSTLMKILSGVFKPDSGSIIYNGEEVVIKNPHQAQMDGISIIFQEFSLIKHMSVTENVFLNREPVSRAGFLRFGKARERVRELMALLDINLDPDAKVMDLSVVQQQLVEIMKALSVDARILIMDEPSAPLTDKELKKLFSIIRSLKSRGVTVIYISHMLEEVFEIADRVTVIKDGKVMGTFPVEKLTKDNLVGYMVGREIQDIYPDYGKQIGDTIMKVEDLSCKGELEGITFSLRKGEVLGLAGMVGSGRTRLVQAIVGAVRRDSGTITVNGKVIDNISIIGAITEGFCYIPSDRKLEGIITSMDIVQNTTITSLKKFMRSGIIDRKKERIAAEKQIAAMQIKTASLFTQIENLSGGNQQKVLIARALLTDPEIFVIVEPTRGIDVGAKYEIYKLVRELTESGKAILMVSSELPEVLGMSDRIMVLNRGRVAGILDQHEKLSSEEELLSLAVGHTYSLSS